MGNSIETATSNPLNHSFQTALSSPHLLTPDEIAPNANESTQVNQLINSSFRRSKTPDPTKWDLVRSRFPSTTSLSEMLGTEGLMAVIYDNSDAEVKLTGNAKGKAVACAAAVPWKGGWESDGKDSDGGWEIKTVCVDGDPKYLRKGLALTVLAFLEKQLIEMELKRRVGAGTDDVGRRLKLWIQAAECINGAYWKKRGYTEVKRKVYEKPTWGCLTNFELVVGVREVELPSKGTAPVPGT
ncbi:hypothetical protein BCR34DRAFT_580436 [Clohesyomyces aquaticus]|uniref:N-acetyltransferase domain-containing protein n=1 Tax=Clohesyomyces aquaticus TaxID=1231657 RepID=A0A1Y1Y6M9_9PLEO|nr:hypothetical protein BCR34DRAFT_580436 [Clohesyomyces aquaticus]